MLLGLFGAWVDCGDYAGDACFFEGFTDEVVEFACADVWEYGVTSLGLVFLEDLKGGGG